MKHQTFEQLKSIGAIETDFPRASLSRTERLERWAELLEQISHHRLSTLRETEYQHAASRNAMRENSTPISVAFRDGMLRDAGLQNDTYGEAKRFFEISDNQLHGIVCYCHFGNSVSGADAASRVRSLLRMRSRLVDRVRAFFAL